MAPSDDEGVGMDRTEATGTGFIASIATSAASFESLGTCPDNLLLFMHHVPYTHKLQSGKTVIQNFMTRTIKVPMRPLIS